MRLMSLALLERLARDPKSRARIMEAVNNITRNYGRRSPCRAPGPIIDHPPRGKAWAGASTGTRPGFRSGARTEILIWIGGALVLLIWSLLSLGAYGLWSVSGDWLLAQSGNLDNGLGGLIGIAEPITWALRLISDFGGPVLTTLWVGVSLVILLLTALAAHLLGNRRGGSWPSRR